MRGKGLPNARRRRRDDEPVMRVRDTREKPTPQPTAVDRLAQLIDQVAALQRAQVAAEEAAAARHAEILARFDRVEAAIALVDDTAGCARTDVEELKRSVRGWLEQLLAVVDPLDDDPCDADCPEDCPGDS